MSYILDALRRADAERERGSVPDLRAQPMASASTEERRAGFAVLPWAAGGAALVLLAVLAWAWLGHDEAAPVVAIAPPPPAAKTAPAPAAAAPPLSTEKAAVTVVAAAPPAHAAIKPAVRTDAAPAAVPARPTPASAPSASEARIYAQRELPEDIRRQLPPLAIGGSMYSEAPANRMLIINGQLFHEHDQPAPGVSLEQIRLKSAVLGFKGYRFELSY